MSDLPHLDLHHMPTHVSTYCPTATTSVLNPYRSHSHSSFHHNIHHDGSLVNYLTTENAKLTSTNKE